MLKLKNVSKSFGKIKAVEDVSIHVDKGEFVFIVGPSGAGKSTLLKLVLREYLPDNGEIFFEGNNIHDLSAKEVPLLRQKIGMVFQDFKVLPERTLRENIEVALAVSGIGQNKWGPRVDNVLKLVELTNRADLFPSQLSGGEIQRVSLARALVINPKLILADEPTGNLDWKTAESILDLLKRINEEGKTVIMVTHHEGLVGKHKKRIIKMDKGKIKGAKIKAKSKPTSKRIKKKIKVEEAQS